MPRNYLRLGGGTLLRHQLSLALAAGCSRIVCVAGGIAPELIEAQHAAEQAGATFHVVNGPRGLSPLVTAADEILVVSEGLLPALPDVMGLLASPVVLVQSAERGVQAGFERIDINSAAAGLMLLPGRLVERLMDLPPDSDAASALLRIALHAGVAQRPLSEALRGDGRWLLVRSEEEAQAAEDGWMERHTSAVPATPGRLIARTAVRRFGPALLHENRSNIVLAMTCSVLIAIAIALAWFGFTAFALLLAGAGWTLRRAAELLERVRERLHAGSARQGWREFLFSIWFDLALLAMLVFAMPVLPGQYLAERAFAPAMLLGIVRLLPAAFSPTFAAWAEDRLVLCLLLAALAIGKVLPLAVPSFAALLLFAALVLPRAPSPREVGADRLTGV